MKDVQCYELFRGIAHRNHAFSRSSILNYELLFNFYNLSHSLLVLFAHKFFFYNLGLFLYLSMPFFIKKCSRCNEMVINYPCY